MFRAKGTGHQDEKHAHVEQAISVFIENMSQNDYLGPYLNGFTIKFGDQVKAVFTYGR